MEDFEELLKSIPKQKSVTTEVMIKLFRGIGQIIVNQKDAEIAALEQKIDILEDKVDALEQMSRQNSVRINGVPESGQREDMEKIVVKMAKEKLGNNITEADIVVAHRLGKPQADKPRVIIARFVNHETKTALLKNGKKLKNTPMSINEDLTKVRSKLAFEARVLQRNGKIQQTWTRDGTIYIKINDSVIRINNEKGFNELKNNL